MKRTVLGAALLLVLSYNSGAFANTILFERLTTTSPVIPYGQLYADVLDASTPGDPAVEFLFHNNVGLACSVVEIYVDDGAGLLASLYNVLEGGDVSFSAGNSSPAHLPGGNNAFPPFDGIPALGAEADAGPGGKVNHGIDESTDFVGLFYSLEPGKQFSDVTSALADGELRFGLHMQSIAGGSSDSYIDPPGVPEPATLLLVGTGLFGWLGWACRRRMN